jgi:hypothetical protein
MEITVRIENDGSVLALSGSGAEEVLDLRTFGRLEVERASNVHFDAGTQTWEWASVDGRYSGKGFPTRLTAIANEILVLSEAM